MRIDRRALIDRIVEAAKLLGCTDESIQELAYSYTQNDPPIYRIMMQEKSGEERQNGWPDTGCQADMGFYYDLQDAIDAMHENTCDIRECVYDYGYVIEQYPGLYTCPSYNHRIYFKWDKERGGFFEAEEPKNMRMLSF